MAPPTAASSASDSTEEEVVAFGGVSVRLKVDWGVGIGGATWTSGQQLCRHLATYEKRYAALRPRPLRFLELGAGTGVSGLFAAKLFPDSAAALTDLGDHLELLDANVALNELGGRVSTALLDWADPGTFAALDAFAPDVVLAADCAYHASLHGPLVAVLKHACASGATCALGVTKSDTGLAFFDALHAAGLDYALLEPPADAYSALFAVSARPGFGEFRDAREPPWASP